MQRATVNGAELEFDAPGSGEPVVCVDGGVTDAFVPLRTQPALRERYRLITYRRRGYGGSTPPDQPRSIAEQAADCRALMGQLGIERAHLAGHSFGGLIALQVARDSPTMVHSLALLEPALPSVLLNSPEFGAAMGQVMPLYQAGDKAGALDAFLQGACGPEYRKALDQTLGPEAFDRAVAAADTLFQVDLPAVQQWRFTGEDAACITQPVLSVVGAESLPVMREIHKQLQAWFPRTEAYILPRATHLLMVLNPREMAEGLAAFFARHSLRA